MSQTEGALSAVFPQLFFIEITRFMVVFFLKHMKGGKKGQSYMKPDSNYRLFTAVGRKKRNGR